MIRALSFIIACVLTALLAIILYPIAAMFWVASIIGDAVGVISKWIFTHTNGLIKYLWADLKGEKSSDFAGYTTDYTADYVTENSDNNDVT